MIFKDISDYEEILNGKTIGDRMRLPQPYPGLGVRSFAIQGQGSVNGGPADLWGQNTTRTMYDTGYTIGLSSSSASDTGIVVFIDGIEFSTGKRQTTTITLNGRTKVTDTSGILFSRINDMAVVSAASLSNSGVIYAFDSTDTVSSGVPQTVSKIQGRIEIGANVSWHGWYTVPKGYQMSITGYILGTTDLAPSSKYCRIIYAASRNVTNPSIAPIYNKLPIPVAFGGGNGALSGTLHFPVLIDEYNEFKMMLESTGSIQTTAYIECILFPKG